MKQFLLSIAFLLFTFVGFGQCPPGDVVLSSQSDVDDFTNLYPNCTDINGSLRILGTNISSLAPLSVISSIGNGLFISNSNSLTDLSGLENINELQCLTIQANSNLKSIAGLQNVFLNAATSACDLRIENNPQLASLEGLLMTGSEIGKLIIFGNTSLFNLSGLENLVGINSEISILGNNSLTSVSELGNVAPTTLSLFHIENNSSLNSLNGLDWIEGITFSFIIEFNDALTNLNGIQPFIASEIANTLSIGGNENLINISALEGSDFDEFLHIEIFDNPNLSICDIDAICNYIDNPQDLVIENNALGCNTISEVEIECSIVNILDNNFLNALLNHTPTIDTNSDGNIQFDEAEAFTGTLNVANKVISDFTGLEAFVNITGFNGSGNFMSELSLEANTVLTSVDFSNSPDVEKVFMKNGNNTAITSFEGLNCPSLQFVCVDDVAFAKANFTNIDPQVTFVDDCEVLAVSDFNLAETVSVFPNPVSENLTISIASNFNFIKAEVYSISGQKLMETSATQLDMSELSAGIYFVKVVTERGSSTKKIIKK